MNHKKASFVVPPYPITVHVCGLKYPLLRLVDIDPDLAAHDESNVAETLKARSKRGGAHVIVMRLPDEYDEEAVWHESIHAAAFILDTVGSTFCADSMDTVIYPTEYIVRQVKKKFYGPTKSRKRVKSPEIPLDNP